jgi:S1-C subfamily serine protease
MKPFPHMKPLPLLLSLLLLPGVLPAQLPGARQQREEVDIPLLSPAERKTVERQRDDFAKAVAPALTAASKSAVRIWYKGPKGKAAYGTVIGDGTKILTKWSQVMRAVDDFRVEDGDREVRAVKITGVYPDEDLAVLTIEGEPLTPVKWTPAPLDLGGFLVAAQPDGRPAGYGVVSVLERNLRTESRGFLGVTGDANHSGLGVKIGGVTEGSGAGAAGLKAGDVILKVGDREISGFSELQNALWGAKPGTEVVLTIRKGSREENVKVILGSRPEMRQFAEGRLMQMERMGSRLNAVRDEFSSVVETDMVIEPEQAGGPVANLKGEVVGITMSRSGRTRSYIMPAAAIEALLKKESTDPELAASELKEERDQQLALRAREAKGAPRARIVEPDEFQKMQRHQNDMGKLAERIQSELEALERGE